MVGKAVLLECLADHRITHILLINRTPLAVSHPKVKELLVPNFSNLSAVALPQKYDACFHCMGVSVAGLSEKEYDMVTYEFTQNLINFVSHQKLDMVFNHISGEGTDSTEKGKVMWARVKGKTENIIFSFGFKDAYAFRAGMILPEKGIKSKTRLYRLAYRLTWLFFPLLRKMNNITTTTLFGQAMINSLFYPQNQKILHNPDINTLANLNS